MAENNKTPPNQDQRQRAPQSSDKTQKPAANPSKPGARPDDAGNSGGADRDRQGVNKPGMSPGKPNVNPGKPAIDPDRDRMGNKNPPITEPEKPEKIDLDEVDDDEAATQRVNRE